MSELADRAKRARMTPQPAKRSQGKNRGESIPGGNRHAIRA
jgi:hypothetical protein